MPSFTSEFISHERYLEYLGSSAFKNGSLYHNADWLEHIARSMRVDISGVLTKGATGENLALMPIMSKKKGPIKMLGSPLAGMHTEFLGPLLSKGVSDKKIEEVINHQVVFLRERAQYVELILEGSRISHDSLSNIVTKTNAKYYENTTRIVNLEGGEQVVWDSLKGRARNMIRKAEKAKVVVSLDLPDGNWINKFYSMLSSTFHRQGISTPHPLNFYEGLATNLNGDHVVFLSATLNNHDVSYGIFLLFNERLLFLSGTSNLEGLRCGASSAIQWSAMKYGVERGAKVYDLGGTGMSSIDKFKQSFGGHDANHHRWVSKSFVFAILEPMGRWASRKGLVSINR